MSDYSRQPGSKGTCHPRIEQLEDRAVPSVVGTFYAGNSNALDLTTHGAVGEVNGALFRQVDAQPTGTGVINSFVRLQTSNGKVTQEQGYNSDYRKVEFDENTSPQFTRSLKLTDVPKVQIGGTMYLEFLLDINQKSSQPLLSLDELRLYSGYAPNVHGYSSTLHTLGGLTAGYDLDAGADNNWVALNYRLNSGSGSGDMLAYVPVADLGANPGPYLYLYSKFGVNLTGNSGFEEWAAGKSALTDTTGVITGRVTDLNGAGVANQFVYIDINGNGVFDEGDLSTTTGDNGTYTFANLATGLGQFSTYSVNLVTDFTPVSASGSGTVLSPTDVMIALQTNGQHGVADFVVDTSSSSGQGGFF